ncbi:MAG TPA: pilus assembly protein TadG-related protein [Granulicella sp.]
MREFADESGQTIVFAAFAMTLVLGFLGFAIDVGHMRQVKRQLQIDADATALAAAREIRVCGVNAAMDSSCAYMQKAAESALTESDPRYSVGAASADANITLQLDCSGSPADQGLTLQLDGTPCLLGAADPNNKKPGYVETVISKKERTYFASIFGIRSMLISARAEASRNMNPPCIYALNPHDPGSLTFLASALIAVQCGIVVESDSALAVAGLACLGTSAPSLSVTGNQFSLLSLGCIHPRVHVPPPTPADPLAYLPPPPGANDSCASAPAPTGGLLNTTYSGSSTPVSVNVLTGLLHTYTFNPGLYCGGINIALSILANVTFNPGIYVLRQNGLSGGLSITGSVLSSIQVAPGPPGGVMFYSEGPNSSPVIGGLNLTFPSLIGNRNLYPPTSGEYAGVFYYQRADNTAQANLTNALLNGLSAGGFGGAIYTPQATINYTATALGTNNNILVGDKINFTLGVAATLGSNVAAEALNSPLVGDDAVLVQ